MEILVFDNYDSFTYNLVHLVEKILRIKVTVKRNDAIKLEEVERFDKIILSPGPGIPSEAGLLLDLIREYGASKPILGVCLGQQAIGEAFGGRLLNLKEVFHGVATPIRIIEPSTKIFKGLTDGFEAGRYHSWVVDDRDFPKDLQVIARDDQGWIMGLQHRKYPLCGVQFHPESVLTPSGEQILKNWLAD
jgi:anthranilate synthase component 2